MNSKDTLSIKINQRPTKQELIDRSVLFQVNMSYISCAASLSMCLDCLYYHCLVATPLYNMFDFGPFDDIFRLLLSIKRDEK